MSCTGMFSVIVMISGMPASAVSYMASGAKRAGTNRMAQLAPVDSTPWRTVSNTGTPSTHSPPLPGVTPATTLVP